MPDESLPGHPPCPSFALYSIGCLPSHLHAFYFGNKTVMLQGYFHPQRPSSHGELRETYSGRGASTLHHPQEHGGRDMIKTVGYAAQGATAPLDAFRFERREPGENDVRIEILHCGVCHSDLHTARNEWKGTTYPVVPGHEIVGRVSAGGRRGEGVPGGAIWPLSAAWSTRAGAVPTASKGWNSTAATRSSSPTTAPTGTRAG